MYKLNESYFKTWSHNMAYILGLWWADGHICLGKDYTFAISLKEEDSYLLELIKKEIGSARPLSFEPSTTPQKQPRTMARLCLGSKNLVFDIIALGGTTRKSKTLRLPNIPPEFHADFIRGLFDGDGTISFSKSKKNWVANICSASKSFLEEVSSLLRDNIVDLSCPIFQSRGIWTLSFSSNNAKRLGAFIYSTPSLLFLIRKYNKFLEMGEEIRLFKKGHSSVPTLEALSKEQLSTLLEEGLTVRQIALQIGVHHRTISNRLKTFNLDWRMFTKNRPSHKPSPKETETRLKGLTKELLLTRLSEGQSASVIGKDYGVDHKTIRGLCHKWGIDYMTTGAEKRKVFGSIKRSKERLTSDMCLVEPDHHQQTTGMLNCMPE